MSEPSRTVTQAKLPTTSTTDSPTCACCNPPQPLEAPTAAGGLHICPVTDKAYTYDAAEGVAREAALPTEPGQGAAPREDDDFFPRGPQPDKIRRVNPQDPFA